MRTKRNDVNVAGITFIDSSNPKDQMFVMDFNDKVLPGLPDDVPFTDSSDLLRLALSKHRVEGKTVLYDAIAAGMKHLESAEREKRTLVVVSDGGDNASRHTLAQLMQAIEDSQTTIYTVGIADPDETGVTQILDTFLGNLAELLGAHRARLQHRHQCRGPAQELLAGQERGGNPG